jgi:hypothetical protein
MSDGNSERHPERHGTDQPDPFERAVRPCPCFGLESTYGCTLPRRQLALLVVALLVVALLVIARLSVLSAAPAGTPIDPTSQADRTSQTPAVPVPTGTSGWDSGPSRSEVPQSPSSGPGRTSDGRAR